MNLPMVQESVGPAKSKLAMLLSKYGGKALAGLGIGAAGYGAHKLMSDDDDDDDDIDYQALIEKLKHKAQEMRG